MTLTYQPRVKKHGLSDFAACFLLIQSFIGDRMTLEKHFDQHRENSSKIGLPLIHVVLSVIQPHADLDGVALPDPVKNVLHGWRLCPRIAFGKEVFLDSPYVHVPPGVEEEETNGLETFKAPDGRPRPGFG